MLNCRQIATCIQEAKKLTLYPKIWYNYVRVTEVNGYGIGSTYCCYELKK